MMVCKKVIYSGRVQGVGFRYTAERLASGLQVRGYVRNLPTGQVELMIEGEPDQIEQLLERVAARMMGNVTSTDIREETPQGFRGFTIR